MANAQRANKIMIDTAGLVTADRTKIVYAMFTPSTANDSVVIRESSGDSDIFVIQGATAKNTMHFRFNENPLLFSGIYIQSISAGAKLLLVTTTGGG